MLSRAENRDGKHASYKDVKVLMTRDAFMAWAVPEIERFNASHPNDRPSLDRIDNRLDYAFGNIRIISWNEHRRLKKLVRWQQYMDYLQAHPDKLAAFVSKRAAQLSGADTPEQLVKMLEELMGRGLQAQ